MKVLFIITTLDVGGAEKVLLDMLRYSVNRGVEARVFCLSAPGVLVADIMKLGIGVECFNLRAQPWNLRLFWRMRAAGRRWQPEVVHAWMYHACFAATILHSWWGRPRLLWSIHNTHVGRRDLGLATMMLTRVLALLSGRPQGIAYVSQAAQRVHEKLGYRPDKSHWLPNGFDTGRFKPGPDGAGTGLRAELGLSDLVPVVGLVSRDGPQKNIDDFFRAATLLAQERPDVHFVCCGMGLDAANRRLQPWLAGLQGRLHLLGVRRDMPRLYAALTVLLLPSSGESLPNVIGEAMSCGVPCVCTDTGDCAALVGPGGIIVQPLQPAALARACLRLLALPVAEREALGRAARAHIMAQYPLEKSLGSTLALLRQRD